MHELWFVITAHAFSLSSCWSGVGWRTSGGAVMILMFSCRLQLVGALRAVCAFYAIWEVYGEQMRGQYACYRSNCSYFLRYLFSFLDLLLGEMSEDSFGSPFPSVLITPIILRNFIYKAPNNTAFGMLLALFSG